MRIHQRIELGCVIWTLGLAILVPGSALGAPFSFSDNFEDGDISDWTINTAGATGVVEASLSRSWGAGIWSLHVKSIAQGDRACALGPAGHFANLDYTKAYTIDFDFNYDKDSDPNGFHFIEVMAMNGPGGAARHVGLYLDTPGMAGGQDALVYRDAVPSNNTVAGLKEDVWYHLDIDVDPATSTYDLIVSDPQGANQLYDWVQNQWVNQLTTNDIPFIGAGQSDGFFPFRVGDRNADAATYDHGEAYWDNIVIQGTWVPEPAAVSLLALGACMVLFRRSKIRRSGSK